MKEMVDIMAFEDQTYPNVTVQSNVAGRISEIFRLTPPTGIWYMLLPYEFYITPFKLNKSGGDEIDRMGKLFWMIKRAGKETPEELGEFDYLPWYEPTIAQQQNEKFRDNFKLQFPEGTPLDKYVVVPGDVLLLELKSSDVVSWASTDGTQLFFKITQDRLPVDIT